MIEIKIKNALANMKEIPAERLKFPYSSKKNRNNNVFLKIFFAKENIDSLKYQNLRALPTMLIRNPKYPESERKAGVAVSRLSLLYLRLAST